MRLSFTLLAAALAAGCADPGGQTLHGRVNRDDFPGSALGVRAVEDGQVVAQAALRSDGRFDLVVPRGGRYRLEVVTRAGIHQFIVPDHGVTKVLAFDACGDDFDFGDVDFWQEGDPVPECGDGTDPEPCSDGDPNCGGGTDPGECTDPMDPNCNSGCDPATGIGCEDPPPCPDGDPDCGGTDPGCMDPSDPNCGGGGTDPGCPDPTSPDCGCDPANGMDCPPPPPPCDDPNSPDCDPCLLDPTLCDPCATDPALCDPCMGDPDCDPCLANPEWCWPGDCVAADGNDGIPVDNGMCWPDDPTCSDDDPNCWPDPVEPPGCENSGMDPDQPCWEPPQGAIPEDAPPDGMCG